MAGTQFYAVQGSSLRVVQVTHLPKDAIHVDYQNSMLPPSIQSLAARDGSAALSDRFLISIDERPYTPNQTVPIPFEARVVPQVDTYLADVSDGSFTRVMDVKTTDVHVTSEGVFALADDHSVWRVGADAKHTYPVASGVDELHGVNGRLMMRVTAEQRYRTLRDVQPILHGNAFQDDDGDGSRRETELPITDTGVYLDLNRDGRVNKSEPSFYCTTGGDFYFDGLKPGSYRVAVRATAYNGRVYKPSKRKSMFADTTLGSGVVDKIVRFALHTTTSDLFVQGFRDKNENGSRGNNELLVSLEVFIDDNNDKKADGETATYSAPAIVNTDGHATLLHLPTGEHRIRVRWLHSDGSTQMEARTLSLHSGVNRLTVAF